MYDIQFFNEWKSVGEIMTECDIDLNVVHCMYYINN